MPWVVKECGRRGAMGAANGGVLMADLVTRTSLCRGHRLYRHGMRRLPDAWVSIDVLSPRHWSGSDEAIQLSCCGKLDCFARNDGEGRFNCCAIPGRRCRRTPE